LSRQGFIQITNFEEYQHYRDRNPPWIKLYNKLLVSYEFSLLKDNAKWHFCAMLLLASKLDNKIPADPEWIARQIGASSRVDLQALADAGLIHASNLSATCYTLSASTERETETETETEKNPPYPPQGGLLRLERRGTKRALGGIAVPYPEGFSAAWSAYPHFEARSKKILAGKVWSDLGLEALSTSVLEWIAYQRGTSDWAKEGGRMVPGMQVWLKGVDFWEKPRSAAKVAVLEENRLLTPEEIAQRRARER
jgi:hypothetical protein